MADTWTVEVTLTRPDGSRVASKTNTEDPEQVKDMVLMSAGAVRDLYLKVDDGR